MVLLNYGKNKCLWCTRNCSDQFYVYLGVLNLFNLAACYLELVFGDIVFFTCIIFVSLCIGWLVVKCKRISEADLL